MINESVAARAEEICAHLLIFPHISREKYRDLLLDEDLREEVARRLDGVGMQLAESFYSDYFSVRLKESIEADIRFDWAANQRLPKAAMALLVVLWAKMVLPRRAAQDQRVDPDDPNLALFEEVKRPADYVVKVPKEALMAEYAGRFGRSNLLRYFGRLKRLGFIREDRAGRLYEGPLLDLMVDGQRLTTEVQRGALGEILGQSPDAIDPSIARRAATAEPELADAALAEDDLDDDEPLFDLTTFEED